MESPRELRAVCQAGKDRDPGWYLVHRRLSIYLTWALLHTRIQLDQVSLLMMALGAAGAASLCSTNLAVNALGLVMLYGAFLLDKVDGEMARYRRQESVTGILLDRFHHRMVEPLLFLAVAYREFQLTGSGGVLVAGLVTMLAANIIEENQQLPAFIAFKFARETRRWPARSRRESSQVLERIANLLKPLKTFRTFITVLPLVAVVLVLESLTARPFTTYYLITSAVSLSLYLLFQSYYYYSGKLEADIATLTEQVGGIPVPAASPSPGSPPTSLPVTREPHVAKGTTLATTIVEQIPPGRIIQ